MSIVYNISKEDKSYSFEIKLGGKNPCAIVCLEEDKDYSFISSGQVRKVNKGTFVIFDFKEEDEKVSITW